MLDDPIPFRPDAPRCGAASRGLAGKWRPCSGAVVAAGERTFAREPRVVWLSFACAEHVACLADPRPLTDADRAEIAHRREQERRALAGLAFEPVRPLRGA